MLHYADQLDAPKILALFQQYASLFPHIVRHPKYIHQQIDERRVIWDGNTVIIDHIYTRKTKLGDQLIHAGDIKLCQIATKNLGDYSVHSIFQEWMDQYASHPIWLTVLVTNERAKKFYSKYDFQCIGNIDWSNGKILGEIWRRTPVVTKKAMIDAFL